MENKWWVAAGFFLFIAMLVYMLGSCSSVNTMFDLPDDNPMEESVEEFIYDGTGLDIDWTP